MGDAAFQEVGDDKMSVSDFGDTGGSGGTGSMADMDTFRQPNGMGAQNHFLVLDSPLLV